MAFNFGNNTNKPASSSGTNLPSLFGATGANNNQAKPLFGGGAAAPIGGAFGGSASPSGASPFGSTATSGNASTEKSGSSFGATTGNIFGAGSGATTSQPQQGGSNIFGGGSSNPPASSAGQQSGGLFGGGSTAAPAGNLFGGQSANPSGRSTPTFSFGGPKSDQGSGTQAPASKSLFGGQNNSQKPASSAAPAGGSSLFGGGATAAPSGGLSSGLNKPSGASSPAVQAPGGSAAPSGGLFGGQTTAPASGQQNKPAASTLFGGVAANPAPSGLFGSAGNKDTPASSAGGGSSLFSNLGASSAPPAPGGSTTPQGNKTLPMPSFTPAGNPPANVGMFGGAAARPTSSLFSQPPKADENKKIEAPKSGGFSFGGMGEGAATTAPAKSSAPLFGEVKGNGQQADKAANPPPTSGAPSAFGGAFKPSSTPASSAAPTSNLFGGATQAPAANASAAQPSSSATTSSAPVTSNLFGAAPTASSSSSGSTPAPAAAKSSLFGASTAKQDTQQAQPQAQTQQQSQQSQQPASRLQNKSLEEILTTWSTSLATHQTRFATLANQVSVWDRELTTNSTSISKLYARCFQAERDAAEVERQLSVVEGEQQNLDSTLAKYEAEVDQLMEQAGISADGSTTSGVDQERERTYRIAESCADRLTEMNQSLAAMIEGINESSTKLTAATKGSGGNGSGAEDPLAQIVRTLNRHLTQLSVVDQGAADLRRRVEMAQQEAWGLGGRVQGAGGRETESFGRSYLGAR